MATITQYFSAEATDEAKAAVQETLAKADLRLNTTSVMTHLPVVGRGHSNWASFSDFLLETWHQVGKGMLLLYGADQTLLWKLQVDVRMGIGQQTLADPAEHTPVVLKKLGRYRGQDTTQEFKVPRDSGGFVLAAPRQYWELIPIADPAGALADGGATFHTTELATGEVSEAYLLMTHDSQLELLEGLPSDEQLSTASPAQLQQDEPALVLRWAKLPVGTEATDVVRLSGNQSVQQGRVIATDSVRFTLNPLTDQQETDVLSAVRGKADAVGFEVVEHPAL